jgi:thiamine-phosphate pyrophosphorylase
MQALPRFYPILDGGLLRRRGISIHHFAQQMRDAGVTLLQYREKLGAPQIVLANAGKIREIFADVDCTLILNDRADLARLAGWDGVHLGQEDLSPGGARVVLGGTAIIGLSTHNEDQIIKAEACPSVALRDDNPFQAADYLAIGPVFSTGTKENPDPVVGLEGVRRARALTKKPLVAIGGITRANAASVIEAGADSVAVIAELLAGDDGPEKVTRDFLSHLR